MTNKGYSVKEFNGLDDIWEIAIKLYEEYKKELPFTDAVYTVSKQLTVFSCPNHFHDEEFTSDINMYFYCKDMNVSPYEGSYNKQPSKWVEKYYIIKSILNKLESVERQKANKG